MSMTTGGSYRRDNVRPLWRKKCEHPAVRFTEPYRGKGLSVYDRDARKSIPLSNETEQFAVNFTVLLRKNPSLVEDPVFCENFLKDWYALMPRLLRGNNQRLSSSNSSSNSPDKRGWWTKEVRRWDWARLVKDAERLSAASARLGTKERRTGNGTRPHALIDGQRIPLTRNVVDREGIFMGRGFHPLNGRIRRRILAEDVDVNISSGTKAPSVPKNGGKRWRSIVHDPAVTWLARWKDPLTGVTKYLQLDGSSDVKQFHDRRKFEMARTLCKESAKVRARIDSDCATTADEDAQKREIAACAAVIHAFGIRVGNDAESCRSCSSETVGATSLKKRNIETLSRNRVRLRFVGKDHVFYDAVREVSVNAHNVLAYLVRSQKKEDDPVFPAVQPQDVNAYLDAILPGLTSKVVRTCMASSWVDGRIRVLKGTLRKRRCSNDADLVAFTKSAANLCFYETAWLLNHRTQVDDRRSRAIKGNDDDGVARALEDFASGCQGFWTRLLKVPLSESRREVASLLDRGKDLRLSPNTSKANYVDPRIVWSLCNATELPCPKGIYSASMAQKFRWAASASSSFRF